MPKREMIEPGIVRGDYWHTLQPASDGSARVQCDLCPRFCQLKEGQHGFCFVREARDGGVVLNSYGRASGFCVDPVEKKPLNHFLPGTAILSFGTAGCNLGCRFCQNWDISKAKDNHRLSSWASPEQLAEAALSNGCRSVAFTYNDPVIFAEYAIDCAIACHERGLKTAAVTAGYITSEARRDFFAHLDAANIDLKAFTEDFYKKLCFAHLEPVLDTIEWVANETDVWIELTTLLIPGHNDSSEELKQLCGWVLEHVGPEVPVHFTAFHPDFKLIDLPATPASTLVRARRLAKSMGLKHVYTGNVHDRDGQSTFCGECGELLIERDWYQLGRWNLDDKGSCKFCGAKLAGHYESKKGDWGPQRRPLQIV